MVPISALYSRLLIQVPGCPEPTAEQALLDTAIEFCEKTLVLRQELDVIVTRDGLGQFDLDPPTDQHAIARVVSVTFDGRPLKGAFPDDTYALDTNTGNPRIYYTRRTDNEFTLNLYPVPDSRKRVITTVALRPTRNATEIDDDLYNYHADALVHGAVSRLTVIPNQPFTDLAYASASLAMFRDDMARAKIDGYQGRTVGTSRVKMNPFV